MQWIYENPLSHYKFYKFRLFKKTKTKYIHFKTKKIILKLKYR